MASFSVVVIAKEECSVIEFFVTHYLQLQPDRIQVFYDGSAPFDFPIRHASVEFIECDDAFWQARGTRRPDDFNVIQKMIYRLALDTCPSDWLLTVDCDEMLIGSSPIQTLLAKLPQDVDVVRIPNVEAVWGPNDDITQDFGTRHFRRFARNRFERGLLKLIYLGKWPYLKRGLAGHSAGKQFIRAGAKGLEIGVHTSRSEQKGAARWLRDYISDEILVCHFDALSFTRWKQKMIDRAIYSAGKMDMPAQRIKLVKLAADQAAKDEDGLSAIFRRFYTLSGVQRLALSLTNMLIRRDLAS